MKDEKLSLSDFISKVKEITNHGIAEISKVSDKNYIFRVSEVWYRISYYNDFGMVIGLTSGADRNDITNLICHSEIMLNGTSLRKEGDSFMSHFEEIYVSHLVFKNKNILTSLSKYISIIEKCSLINKLSSDVFVIVVDNVKYIFERTCKYSIEKDTVLRILEISCFSENGLKTKKIYDYKKIESILSVLNAIYFLNKNAEDDIMEDEILKLFS